MNDAKPEMQSDTEADRKTRQVELLISNLLRFGVLASFLVIVSGMVVTFVHHPEYIHSANDTARLTTPSRAEFPRTVATMIHGVRAGEGRAIVIAGLLLLIATPVLRVAVSILAFVYERDRTFVIITMIVLALLLSSFILGKATG